jgi:hypothetical protein
MTRAPGRALTDVTASSAPPFFTLAGAVPSAIPARPSALGVDASRDVHVALEAGPFRLAHALTSRACPVRAAIGIAREDFTRLATPPWPAATFATDTVAVSVTVGWARGDGAVEREPAHFAVADVLTAHAVPRAIIRARPDAAISATPQTVARAGAVRAGTVTGAIIGAGSIRARNACKPRGALAPARSCALAMDTCEVAHGSGAVGILPALVADAADDAVPDAHGPMPGARGSESRHAVPKARGQGQL